MKNNSLFTLTIILILFIGIIVAIAQIINMALPTSKNSGLYSDKIREIDGILSSQSEMKKVYESPNASENKIIGLIKTDTVFSEKINTLPKADRGVLIQNKLQTLKVELMVRDLQNKLENQTPLIFKLQFWIYGFVVWAGTIVLGMILRYWTQRFIISRWDPEYRSTD